MIQSNFTDLYINIIAQQWEYMQIITFFMMALKPYNYDVYKEAKKICNSFWNKRKKEDKSHIQVFKNLFRQENLMDTLRKL